MPLHEPVTFSRLLKSGQLLKETEIDIGATHKMSELGAKAIYIWEEQSNGDYEIVRTYSSGLIDTNTDAAYRKITYYGDSGTKYYATVALYAKDSSGSETLYSDTRVITA